MNPTKLVFGSENAESDLLLYDCKISIGSVNEQKPILIGKWGTGKSAILLLSNKRLTDELQKIDPEKSRIWYMDEKSLNLKSIYDLYSEFSGNAVHFSRALEGIWKAEIVRVFCELLSILNTNYYKRTGSSWNEIDNAFKSSQSLGSIWSYIPTAVNLILKKDITSSIQEIQIGIKKFFDNKTVDNIQKCLKDIKDDEVFPSVAIEPIETPYSNLENHNGKVAHLLITSLLNLYKSHFEVTDNQLMQIRLSIPWHRYNPVSLDFPQKIDQYEGFISWNKEKLKEFIDKRILWEFKEVGRKISSNINPWHLLFGQRIKNDHCQPEVYEDTFDYILRHTHHRARDLQRLARRCVENQADIYQCELNAIISGKYEITESCIRDTLRKEGRKSTNELLIEGKRRFNYLEKIEKALFGLSVPFTTDDLKKRLEKYDLDLNNALDILWNVGIVGVMAETDNHDTIKWLNQTFGTEAKRIFYNKENKAFIRWFWFEYNWESDAPDIIDRLKSLSDVNVSLVLHPRTFEFFVPQNVTKNCPIGI